MAWKEYSITEKNVQYFVSHGTTILFNGTRISFTDAVRVSNPRPPHRTRQERKNSDACRNFSTASSIGKLRIRNANLVWRVQLQIGNLIRRNYMPFSLDTAEDKSHASRGWFTVRPVEQIAARGVKWTVTERDGGERRERDTGVSEKERKRLRKAVSGAGEEVREARGQRYREYPVLADRFPANNWKCKRNEPPCDSSIIESLISVWMPSLSPFLRFSVSPSCCLPLVFSFAFPLCFSLSLSQSLSLSFSLYVVLCTLVYTSLLSSAPFTVSSLILHSFTWQLIEKEARDLVDVNYALMQPRFASLHTCCSTGA